jgi:hypothetical protein
LALLHFLQHLLRSFWTGLFCGSRRLFCFCGGLRVVVGGVVGGIFGSIAPSFGYGWRAGFVGGVC